MKTQLAPVGGLRLVTPCARQAGPVDRFAPPAKKHPKFGFHLSTLVRAMASFSKKENVMVEIRVVF